MREFTACLGAVSKVVDTGLRRHDGGRHDVRRRAVVGVIDQSNISLPGMSTRMVNSRDRP
jgi:hypothetical protein